MNGMRKLFGILRGKPRYMFSATNWFIFRVFNFPFFYFKALVDKLRSFDAIVVPTDLPAIVVGTGDTNKVLSDGRIVISSSTENAVRLNGEVTLKVKGQNVAMGFLVQRELLCRVAGLSAGGLYQQADHPLLREVKHHRGEDRIGIVSDCVSRLCPTRALDIGANMGLISQAILRRGVPTMSVEMNHLFHHVLRERLKMFDVSETFCGSVFDLPRFEYDLVIAFSIFHHFLVTEDIFRDFTKFLENLRCRYMLFEPHQTQHGFEGAYADFNEEEFCEFICAHSVLNSYERIAESARRRPIYLLQKK